MKNLLYPILFSLLFISCSTTSTSEKINRKQVVNRHNPKIDSFDTLGSLSVGNGNFAFTTDATGLQTLPQSYSNGVPLGTMSQWGWHSVPNKNNYKFEESLKNYDFGRGRDELYAVQFNEDGRQKDAANYFRQNMHRIHLGVIGFEGIYAPIKTNDISNIKQELDLWEGIISSSFNLYKEPVNIKTACHPKLDMIGVGINTPLFEKEALAIKFHFPYPTTSHTDDACDWNSPEKHSTELIEKQANRAVFKRTLDTTTYYVIVDWEGTATIQKNSDHKYLLIPTSNEFSFTAQFDQNYKEAIAVSPSKVWDKSSTYWNSYWSNGGFIDLSGSTHPQAMELERRVILSQYLMAIQSAGMYPPQETGLTYNSWHGKFHLEMHWWHAVHFALWNRTDLLERSLDWYFTALPVAREIAKRQGYDGVRWMKMTDPVGTEAPSKVGSFLIWQQPHIIYFSELIYRQNPTDEVLNKYKELVFETADFMADFVQYDNQNDRYTLNGIIPAQETLNASETINPPLELSYWYYGLKTAQEWRIRLGLEKNSQWETILEKLSPLAQKDGLYLAAESALDTYTNIRYMSDHMAVLGAYGMLPENRLFEKDTMKQTLNFIWENWNWDHTWGWDYPLTALCATRLGEPEIAVNALLTPRRTNTYLVNGHNYQDGRLRVYLPGNGGLLTTVALMCAGWDGCETKNPGFPKNDQWNIRWENINKMP